MTNHEWARKQINFYKNEIEFNIKEMKYERETIKRENAFIKEAQKDGYTFTTTKEKRHAEHNYNYFYRQKKHAERMVKKYERDLNKPDFTLFDEPAKEKEIAIFENGCTIECEFINNNGEQIRIVKTVQNIAYRFIYKRNEHNVFIIDTIKYLEDF